MLSSLGLPKEGSAAAINNNNAIDKRKGRGDDDESLNDQIQTIRRRIEHFIDKTRVNQSKEGRKAHGNKGSDEGAATTRKAALRSSASTTPSQVAPPSSRGITESVLPHRLLLPAHHLATLEDLCRKHKIHHPMNSWGGGGLGIATATADDHKNDDDGTRKKKGSKQRGQHGTASKKSARALLADVAAQQFHLEKENAVLAASIAAIEALARDDDNDGEAREKRARDASSTTTTAMPASVLMVPTSSSQPDASSRLPPPPPLLPSSSASPSGHGGDGGSPSPQLLDEASIARVMGLVESHRTLQLLYQAYGIEDLAMAATGSHSSSNATVNTTNKSNGNSIIKSNGATSGINDAHSSSNNNHNAIHGGRDGGRSHSGDGVGGGATLTTLYQPRRRIVSTAAQTEPEHLAPLDGRLPGGGGLFESTLWVRSRVTRRGDAVDVEVTIIDPSVASPAAHQHLHHNNRHISTPYAPCDWDHPYDAASAPMAQLYGGAGGLGMRSSISRGLLVNSEASATLLALSKQQAASSSGGRGELWAPIANSSTGGGSTTMNSPAAGAAVGGASAVGLSGSLRAACDAAYAFRTMVALLTRPCRGAALHRVEPSSLRTSLLTECDPASPNKVRLAVPMTHISSNAYAMGVVVVRDHDLLLFKEGAEDKKLTRLPYRAIASIRLGCAPQAVDKTTPPPLIGGGAAIPPAATQFFLMNKIQFSDTYRQFYRTAVIQPLDVGDGAHGGAAAATAAGGGAQQQPSPLSIIFDTETDCARFLSVVDLLLAGPPSRAANPFSCFAGAGGTSHPLPMPRGTLGLDLLNIAGGRPAAVPTVYAGDGGGGGGSHNAKRQLAYAKNALLSALDVFPTHEPLTLAETELCASLHIAPRQFSEIKTRLITDPSAHRTWLSMLDVAVLCSPPNSKTLNTRLARQLVDFFVSQNKIEPIEIVETLPC